MDNFQLQDQGEFKCTLCSSRFTRRWNLEKHEKRVHSGNTAHVCSLCSSGFNAYKYLRFHILRYHRDTALYFQITGQISKANVIGGKRPMIKYNANKRGRISTSCAKRSKVMVRKEPNILPLNSKFKCSFCPKQATRKCNVEAHEKKVHSGNTPHVCSICSSAFNKYKYLRYHISIHHRNTDPCSDIVDAKSSTTAFENYPKRSELAVQKKSKCLQESSIVFEKNQVICSICNKSFSTINRLTKHKTQFHSKNFKAEKNAGNAGKAFKCSFCDASFTMNCNKIRHERRFHLRNVFSKTNRKKISKFKNVHAAQPRCQISYSSDSYETKPVSKPSERNYSRRSKFTSIIRTPGGVELIYANELCCSYCPKFFAHSGSKQIHEKIHTGDWTNQCKFCHASFRLPHSLVAHEKKCLDLIGTIWCQFCDYRNKSQSEVDHHYRVAHGFDVNQSEAFLPEENDGNFELSNFIDVSKEEFSSDDEYITEADQENDAHWSQFIVIDTNDDD